MIKLFKKKDSKDDIYTEELLDEIDFYKGKLAKLQHDFNEYKASQGKLSRSHEDKTVAHVIEEFLGVKESLEKALGARGKRDYAETMKGIRQISKQMNQTLRTLGVEIVNPKNEPFDPEYHEALKKTTIKTLPDETVIKVFSKGYIYKDKVIRPARVAISSGGIRRGQTPRGSIDWEDDRPKRRRGRGRSRKRY
jgi:molecular chaperone GrpE